MSDFQAHQQLVLRLHDDLAARVRGDMTGEGEYPSIELKRQGMIDWGIIYLGISADMDI